MTSVRVCLALVVVSFVVVSCIAIARRADREAANRTPATCLNDGCYCERTESSGTRQPINAWSSLAPAIAGAWLLVETVTSSRRRRPARLPGIVLGIAACSIAVFSFHYHATLTWLGEWLDGVSLYWLAGFPIACVLARRFGDRVFSRAYLSVALLPSLASWLVPALRKPLFMLIAIGATAVILIDRSLARRAGGRWLVLALGCFAIASVAWALDAARIVCAPTAWWQLHSLWHLLSAPTIYALYRYSLALDGGLQ